MYYIIHCQRSKIKMFPSLPHIVEYIKSHHFAFMPQSVLQSLPPPLLPLIHPSLPVFASQSADAKSLRDPSKIKAIRLQVRQTFELRFLVNRVKEQQPSPMDILYYALHFVYKSVYQ